jgi:hypothetical protein
MSQPRSMHFHGIIYIYQKLGFIHRFHCLPLFFQLLFVLVTYLFLTITFSSNLLPPGAQLHRIVAYMCPYASATCASPSPCLSCLHISLLRLQLHSMPQQKFNLGHFLDNCSLWWQLKFCTIYCDMIYKWAQLKIWFQHDNIHGFACKNRCFRDANFLWDNWQSDFLWLAVSAIWMRWRVSGVSTCLFLLEMDPVSVHIFCSFDETFGLLDRGETGNFQWSVQTHLSQLFLIM